MKQLSNKVQPHDHEKQYDKEHYRQCDAAATASDALLGAFGETFVPFTAPGEKKADDTTD